jgi:hypothetical protein
MRRNKSLGTTGASEEIVVMRRKQKLIPWVAQRLHSPKSRRRSRDTETPVWVWITIVILLGLACFAYIGLLEKVRG